MRHKQAIPEPTQAELRKWAKEQPARDQSKLLAQIDKAIKKKTKPRIKAYSCHNYIPGQGCPMGCVNTRTRSLNGHKIYWVKGRPYTLEGGHWGSEYSETVLSLKDLKG